MESEGDVYMVPSPELKPKTPRYMGRCSSIVIKDSKFIAPV